MMCQCCSLPPTVKSSPEDCSERLGSSLWSILATWREDQHLKSLEAKQKMPSKPTLCHLVHYISHYSFEAHFGAPVIMSGLTKMKTIISTWTVMPTKELRHSMTSGILRMARPVWDVGHPFGFLSWWWWVDGGRMGMIRRKERTKA
jgi:hypothetical protein